MIDNRLTAALLHYSFWIMVLCLFFSPFSMAAQSEGDQILDAILSSFDLSLDDLSKKKHESEFLNLFDGLSGNFAIDFPLTPSKAVVTDSSGIQRERSNNNITFQASIKYNPLTYWFFSTTLYYYLDQSLQAPYNPDFSYSFGYDDWHPYTLSLVYSNYGGNRLNPDKQLNEKFTTVEEGTISLGWKFLVPDEIDDIFLIDTEAYIGCSLNLNLTPSYNDVSTNSRRKWKRSYSVGCKYPIFDWFYINATAYYYPDKTQQQPFDPDYTYGFGYFDWHPGTISLQYNNYAGNRYPWRNQNGAGTFKNGSITLSWSWAF